MIAEKFKSYHVIEDEQTNFFIQKIFFLIFFSKINHISLDTLNFESYLRVTYFNSKFIVIIFHHRHF